MKKLLPYSAAFGAGVLITLLSRRGHRSSRNEWMLSAHVKPKTVKANPEREEWVKLVREALDRGADIDLPHDLHAKRRTHLGLLLRRWFPLDPKDRRRIRQELDDSFDYPDPNDARKLNSQERDTRRLDQIKTEVDEMISEGPAPWVGDEETAAAQTASRSPGIWRDEDGTYYLVRSVDEEHPGVAYERWVLTPEENKQKVGFEPTGTPLGQPSNRGYLADPGQWFESKTWVASMPPLRDPARERFEQQELQRAADEALQPRQTEHYFSGQLGAWAEGREEEPQS